MAAGTGGCGQDEAPMALERSRVGSVVVATSAAIWPLVISVLLSEQDACNMQIHFCSAFDLPLSKVTIVF